MPMLTPFRFHSPIMVRRAEPRVCLQSVLILAICTLCVLSVAGQVKSKDTGDAAKEPATKSKASKLRAPVGPPGANNVVPKAKSKLYFKSKERKAAPTSMGDKVLRRRGSYRRRDPSAGSSRRRKKSRRCVRRKHF